VLRSLPGQESIDPADMPKGGYLMKCAVAGLSLFVMFSSALFGDSGHKTSVPYHGSGIQVKAVMQMAEFQSQPSSRGSAHPATGGAGEDGVTKRVDT